MPKLPHISLAGIIKFLFIFGFALAFIAVSQFPEISSRNAAANGFALPDVPIFGVPLGRNLKFDVYTAFGVLAIAGLLVFTVLLPLIQKRLAKERRPVFTRQTRVIMSAVLAMLIGLLGYAYLNAKVDPARQSAFATDSNDHLIAMAYNDNFKKMIVGSENGIAYLWNEDRQSQPIQLATHFGGSFSAAAYAPSGDFLALGSTDSTVRLFSVDGTFFKSQLKQPDGSPITVLGFAPEKKIMSLVAGYGDGSVALWHPGPSGENASPSWILPKVHDLAVTALAFDPNSKFVATGSQDHSIRILDLQDQRQIARPFGNPDKLVGLSFGISGDPILKLSGLSDAGTLITYDYQFNPGKVDLPQIRQSKPRELNQGLHNVQTTDLRTSAFSQVAQIYATAPMEGNVTIRRLRDDCHIGTIPKSAHVNSMVFDASGTHLITGNQDGQVDVWTINPAILAHARSYSYCHNLNFEQVTDTLQTHQPILTRTGQAVTSVAWNDQTGVSMLAITNANNDALVCSHVLPTEEPTCHPIQGPVDDVTHVAFGGSQDNDNLVVLSTRDGYVRSARVEGNALKPVAEMGWMDAPINILAPKPNSPWVIVGNTRGELRVWNSDSSVYTTTTILPKHHAEISAMAWSQPANQDANQAGDLFVTGDQDGNLTVWSWRGLYLDNPRILRAQPKGATSPVPTGRITALAFSRDGKHLVSTSLGEKENPENLCEWALADDTLENTFTVPNINISHLALSQDATKIAVSGDGSTVLVVPLDGSAPTSFDAHVVPMTLAVQDKNLVAAGMSANQLQEWNVANLDTITLPGTNSAMESALMGTPLLRFLVAALIPFGLVFGLLWVGMQSQGKKIASFLFLAYPNYDSAKGRQYVVNVMEGQAPFKQIVRGGELMVDGDPKLLPPNAAGPGEVTVPEGYAAVLEKNGSVSQIVGAGVHFLEKDELATMSIPLYPRTEIITVKDVMTRDQMRFSTITAVVRHKVAGVQDHFKESKNDSGSAAGDGTKKGRSKKPARQERYEANSDIIHYQIWNPDHKDYTDQLKGLVTNQIRTLVGSEYFEDLYSGFGGTRKQLQDTLQARVKKSMEARGVEVETVAVTELGLTDRIAKVLQARKQAELERQVKIASAQTARDTRVIRQGAKAALREALIRQIADPLRDKSRGVIIDSQIAVRYIQAIERLSLDFFREDMAEERAAAIDGTVISGESKPIGGVVGPPDAPLT